MSVSAADFLSSAKGLLADNAEISARSAASRAYYAAYHGAQNVFPADKDSSKYSDGGVHVRYIDQLMQAAPGTTMRAVAVKLSALKGRRVRADYHLDDDVKKYEAIMAVQAAQEVLDLLSSEYSKSPAPTDSADSLSKISECAPDNAGRPKLQRIF